MKLLSYISPNVLGFDRPKGKDVMFVQNEMPLCLLSSRLDLCSCLTPSVPEVLRVQSMSGLICDHGLAALLPAPESDEEDDHGSGIMTPVGCFGEKAPDASLVTAAFVNFHSDMHPFLNC